MTNYSPVILRLTRLSFQSLKDLFASEPAKVLLSDKELGSIILGASMPLFGEFKANDIALMLLASGRNYRSVSNISELLGNDLTEQEIQSEVLGSNSFFKTYFLLYVGKSGHPIYVHHVEANTDDDIHEFYSHSIVKARNFDDLKSIML